MIRLRARMNCLPYNSWYTRSTPPAMPWHSFRQRIRLTYARDISMTQIPTEGRRSGTISLMTKMMKLQLATERSERGTAMSQKLTLTKITTRNSRNQLSRQSHRLSGLQSSLTDFAQYYGHEELSFTLSKVNDILHEIKLRAPKYQRTTTDLFFFLKSILLR